MHIVLKLHGYISHFVIMWVSSQSDICCYSADLFIQGASMLLSCFINFTGLMFHSCLQRSAWTGTHLFCLSTSYDSKAPCLRSTVSSWTSPLSVTGHFLLLPCVLRTVCLCTHLKHLHSQSLELIWDLSFVTIISHITENCPCSDCCHFGHFDGLKMQSSFHRVPKNILHYWQS